MKCISAQRIAVLPKGCCMVMYVYMQRAKAGMERQALSHVLLTVLLVNIWVCIVGGNRCLYIYWQVAHVLFCNIFSFIYAAVKKWNLFNTVYVRDLHPWYTGHFQQKPYIYLFRDLFILKSEVNKSQNNKICTCVHQMTLKYQDIKIHVQYHKKKKGPYSWSLEIKHFIQLIWHHILSVLLGAWNYLQSWNCRYKIAKDQVLFCIDK